MAEKPHYPELLNDPIKPYDDLDKAKELRVAALKEHFGTNDDWEKIALGLAKDHLRGFRGLDGETRGRKPSKTPRDLLIIVGMSERIGFMTNERDAKTAADTLYEESPDLGSSGEAIRQRWQELKKQGNVYGRAIRLMVDLLEADSKLDNK
jgi:hypothetical protein